MTLVEFVTTGTKILTSWQKDMPHREEKIVKILMSLFAEVEGKSEEPSQEKMANNYGKST